MECYKCGKSHRAERLYDAISREGLVKVCSKCAQNDELPVVKKPTTHQLKESERERSVNERLYDAAGLSKSNNEIKVATPNKDISLRDIIDRNFEEKNKQINKQPRPDLVENFHWNIMRARRKKHLTTSQLAREIGESEVAIKMAERGKMPEDDKKLINKLESFLGVQISKNSNNNPRKELDINPATAKNTTIADLKKLKEEREKKDKSEEKLNTEEIENPEEELFNEVYKNLEEDMKKNSKKTFKIKNILKKFSKKEKEEEKDYTEEWEISPEFDEIEKREPYETDKTNPVEENFTSVNKENSEEDNKKTSKKIPSKENKERKNKQEEEKETKKKENQNTEKNKKETSSKNKSNNENRSRDLSEKDINSIIFGKKK